MTRKEKVRLFMKRNCLVCLNGGDANPVNAVLDKVCIPQGKGCLFSKEDKKKVHQAKKEMEKVTENLQWW